MHHRERARVVRKNGLLAFLAPQLTDCGQRLRHKIREILQRSDCIFHTAYQHRPQKPAGAVSAQGNVRDRTVIRYEAQWRARNSDHKHADPWADRKRPLPRHERAELRCAILLHPSAMMICVSRKFMTAVHVLFKLLLVREFPPTV